MEFLRGLDDGDEGFCCKWVCFGKVSDLFKITELMSRID